MLFLFGKGTKYIKKEEGKSETRHCPNCKRSTTFYEAVPAEYLHIFFVPIYTDTSENTQNQAIWQCSRCESTYTTTGSGITMGGALVFLKKVAGLFIGFFSYLVILFKESEFIKKQKAKRKEQHIKNELDKLKKKIQK
jgi:hypothetical protein